MTVGWFNLQHADKPLRLIPAFDNDQDLNWNIAAGLLRPDDKLRERVDAAIEALLADGTIARIYARYGIELDLRSEHSGSLSHSATNAAPGVLLRIQVQGALLETRRKSACGRRA